MTNEELRAEYVRVMGSELGPLCHELVGELDLLRQKWGEFQVLFEKGPERIELLKEVASQFFGFMHNLLYEDAIMHICRLTDPPATMGHKNLTLMRLAESIPDPVLNAQVQNDAEEVRKKCEFARKLRDKRLAHTDLESLRNPSLSPLPNVTSKNIEEALRSMRALLYSVEQHYGLPPSLSFPDPWGATSLVHYLEVAVRAKENERQHWRELAGGKSGTS